MALIGEMCSICLVHKKIVYSITTEDEFKVKWKEKLELCVPSIKWDESGLICQICTEQLQTAFQFINMCTSLHSNNSTEESIDNNLEKILTNISEESQSENNNQRTVDKTEYINNESKESENECKATYNEEEEEIEEFKVIIEKETLKQKRKTSDAIFKCEQCEAVFKKKFLLTRHTRNVHAKEKMFKCDECSQRFASSVYLAAHKRYHLGVRSHICSFCGKGFITASDLYHHEKTHLNKRGYKCPECPKAFNTSSDLHKHKICVHLDHSLWKYVCAICSKRFPLKTNLDSHIKVHTGEKNFACHICEHRCINKSALNRHILTHTNVKSLKCTLCSQEYKYQKSLSIHMSKSHGVGDAPVNREKNSICHLCPKAFHCNSRLQKHLRTHNNELQKCDNSKSLLSNTHKKVD